LHSRDLLCQILATSFNITLTIFPWRTAPHQNAHLGRAVQSLKQKARKLPTMQRAVEDLEQDHSFSSTLVNRLCSRVDNARQVLAAARAEAAAATEPGAATAPQLSEEALQQAAMESLREGCWSYSDVLRELLQTLRVFSLHSSTYFDGRLAERLWDTLMVNPPCREDTLQATQVRGELCSEHSAVM
jgi:hypothetical protein